MELHTHFQQLPIDCKHQDGLLLLVFSVK